MPKFIFRLATLLKLRENARDERRQALADALQAERIVGEQIAELGANLQSLAAQALAHSTGPLNVDRLMDIQRYEMLLRAQRADLERQLERVAAEIEVRRAALAEADRAVRALERLRETQRERYDELERRKDAKRLDEAATHRWLREART